MIQKEVDGDTDKSVSKNHEKERLKLFENYKKVTLDYIKENDISKETINDILFCFHTVIYELFDVMFFKRNNSQRGSKKDLEA